MKYTLIAFSQKTFQIHSNENFLKIKHEKLLSRLILNANGELINKNGNTNPVVFMTMVIPLTMQ